MPRRGEAPAVLLCLGLLAACGEPEPVLRTTRLELVYAPDTSCRPSGAVGRLQVQALGDFGAADELIEAFPPGVMDASLERFPDDTQLLVFTAQGATELEWRGAAVYGLSGARDGDALVVLPLDRSCLLGDSLLSALEGSTVAGLQDGGLLVAGGVEASGRVADRLVVRPAGARIAALLGDDVEPRAHATATRAASRVLLVGGVADRRAEFAHTTYDVLDGRTGALLEARRPLCPPGAPSVCSGRREHGAGALPDGRVLVVGGFDRADGEGAPLPDGMGLPVLLRTGVVIDPLTGALEHLVDTEPAALPPRISPQVLSFEDGTVLVVGGSFDGERALGSIHRIDLASGAVYDLGLPFDSRPHATAVALQQGVAWVGGDTTVQVATWVQSPDDLRVSTFDLLPGDARAAARLGSLEGTRAVRLDDGRLFVAGTNRAGCGAAGCPRAFVIDLDLRSISEVDAPLSAGSLVALEDGTLAEVGAMRTSLRRQVLRTPLDSPPATIAASDLEWLSLDDASAFELRAGSLRAVTRALVHVPTLRFSDLAAVLGTEGRGDLLLRAAGGVVARVSHLEREVDAGVGCSLRRLPGEDVLVERRGERLRLSTATDEVSCRVAGLQGRVSVAVDLDAESDLRILRLRRP